jgi:hypothetical protein
MTPPTTKQTKKDSALLPKNNLPSPKPIISQRIEDLFLELIGDDEEADVTRIDNIDGVPRFSPDGRDMWGEDYVESIQDDILARNKLRAEQRKRLPEATQSLEDLVRSAVDKELTIHGEVYQLASFGDRYSDGSRQATLRLKGSK